MVKIGNFKIMKCLDCKRKFYEWSKMDVSMVEYPISCDGCQEKNVGDDWRKKW